MSFEVVKEVSLGMRKYVTSQPQRVVQEKILSGMFVYQGEKV